MTIRRYPDPERYPYNCTLCKFYVPTGKRMWACGHLRGYAGCKGQNEWIAKSVEERRTTKAPRFAKEE